MVRVNVLVEGSTDELVAKRLLKHVGLEVGIVYGKRGKPDLLSGFYLRIDCERKIRIDPLRVLHYHVLMRM